MEPTNPAPYDELPYFDDYFQQVLRPRVERAVAVTEKAMLEAVWAHVLRLVAVEQKRGAEPAPQSLQHLRALLEQKCGLRIIVTLQPVWNDADARAGSNGQAEPVSGEVVNRRATANPLASAVLANGGR